MKDSIGTTIIRLSDLNGLITSTPYTITKGQPIASRSSLMKNASSAAYVLVITTETTKTNKPSRVVLIINQYA